MIFHDIIIGDNGVCFLEYEGYIRLLSLNKYVNFHWQEEYSNLNGTWEMCL